MASVRHPSENGNLRDEHAATTRRRVIAGVDSLVSERRSLDFTMPEVAERSGVSVATIYRHFDGREGLLEAVARTGVDDPGGLTISLEGDDVVALIREAFRTFDERRAFIEAARTSGLYREMRQRRLPSRIRMFENHLGAALDGLPARDRRGVLGLLLALTSSDTYTHLTETIPLDHDEAADAVAWAVETLVRAVQGGDAALTPAEHQQETR
jgi:AcrR family transcriptional regulator